MVLYQLTGFYMRATLAFNGLTTRSQVNFSVENLEICKKLIRLQKSLIIRILMPKFVAMKDEIIWVKIGDKKFERRH